MEIKSIPLLFRSALLDLFKNPIIAVPFVLLLVLQIFFEIALFEVNSGLVSKSDLVHYVWLSVFMVVVLLIISYLVIGTIAMTYALYRKKSLIREFFIKANRLFVKNFVLIFLQIICYVIVFYLSLYLATFIGKSLALDVNFARAVFFIIYILGIILFLIFFAFISFYLVKDENTLISSIKKSIDFVKHDYLSVLLVFLILFVFNELIRYLDYDLFLSLILSDVLRFVILYPVMILILSRMILKNDIRT